MVVGFEQGVFSINHDWDSMMEARRAGDYRVTQWEIGKIVRRTITKYNTRDPFVLAEKLNVTIVEHQGQERGRLIRTKTKQYGDIILMSSALSKCEKDFVLAHEVGHLILSKDRKKLYLDDELGQVEDYQEAKAHTFAMILLTMRNVSETIPPPYSYEDYDIHDLLYWKELSLGIHDYKIKLALHQLMLLGGIDDDVQEHHKYSKSIG